VTYHALHLVLLLIQAAKNKKTYIRSLEKAKKVSTYTEKKTKNKDDT
jgi:hypothetical protein